MRHKHLTPKPPHRETQMELPDCPHSAVHAESGQTSKRSVRWPPEIPEGPPPTSRSQHSLQHTVRIWGCSRATCCSQDESRWPVFNRAVRNVYYHMARHKHTCEQTTCSLLLPKRRGEKEVMSDEEGMRVCLRRLTIWTASTWQRYAKGKQLCSILSMVQEPKVAPTNGSF